VLTVVFDDCTFIPAVFICHVSIKIRIWHTSSLMEPSHTLVMFDLRCFFKGVDKIGLCRPVTFGSPVLGLERVLSVQAACQAR